MLDCTRFGYGKSQLLAKVEMMSVRRHTKGPLVKMNRCASDGASAARRIDSTQPQSCATMIVFFLFVSEPSSTPYWLRRVTISSVSFSRTLVAEYFFSASLPPYPGRSIATSVAAFCSPGKLTICRHIAQLSGNPWMKITRGLFDFKAAAEPGASLLTK